MKRNNFLSRFIVVTLTAALLLVSGSRAYRVSALADPQPEVWLTPVYDTTIYQFSDYVDNLTQPQFEIFKIAFGVYVAAQGGANKYDLVDPYTTKDGVIGWIKSLGLTAYNSLIDLVPDTYVDPITGNIQSTSQAKELTKYAVAYAMGAAVLAANYSTEQDFIDDMENSNNMFFHFSDVAQYGIHALVALNGGFYDWQFTPHEWDSDFDWTQRTLSGVLLNSYESAVQSMNLPRYPARSNLGYSTNIILSPFDFPWQIDILLNPSNNTITPYAFGANFGNNSVRSQATLITQNNTLYTTNYLWGHTYTRTYDSSLFSSYQQIVDYYISSYNQDIALIYWPFTPEYIFLDMASFIGQVRVGSSWENSVPIENVDDLDFQMNNIQYYEKVTNDYLFDIRQFILDLINSTDLYQPWIDNLFDFTGLQVPNPPTIKVSIDIGDLLALDILPVNLNDIADYTNNSYLDRVKEEAKRGGNALAYLVAFWHNCDAELIYVLFGAGITVLVGAFIGKWGHS